MIIDVILDRKDDSMDKIIDGDLIQVSEYTPKWFYNQIIGYGEIGFGITNALDGGTEYDVKRELCRYILDGDYNLDICDYINSQKWL